jgi:hypothetical protein
LRILKLLNKIDDLINCEILFLKLDIFSLIAEQQRLSAVTMSTAARNRQNDVNESQTLLPEVENRSIQCDIDPVAAQRAEKTILRKIDLKLLPMLVLLYFFIYLNRMSIGTKRIELHVMHSEDVLLFFCTGMAYLLGLYKHLKLTMPQYNWAISIFFVSYVSRKNKVEEN